MLEESYRKMGLNNSLRLIIDRLNVIFCHLNQRSDTKQELLDGGSRERRRCVSLWSPWDSRCITKGSLVLVEGIHFVVLGARHVAPSHGESITICDFMH